MAWRRTRRLRGLMVEKLGRTAQYNYALAKSIQVRSLESECCLRGSIASQMNNKVMNVFLRRARRHRRYDWSEYIFAREDTWDVAFFSKELPRLQHIFWRRKSVCLSSTCYHSLSASPELERESQMLCDIYRYPMYFVLDTIWET